MADEYQNTDTNAESSGGQLSHRALPDSPMLSMIREMITNPDVKATNLLVAQDMYYKDLDRQNEGLYNQAMLRLRPQLPVIRKNGVIDYGKGKKPIKYARHEDIEREIEPLYQAEGFFLEYDQKDGAFIGICKHEAGHKVVKSITLSRDDSGGKNPIQGTVSSLSYAQRALLRMIFNLKFEGDDDDGRVGGMTVISEHLIANIEKLLIETNSDKVAFLRHIEQTDIANIQMKDYQGILSMLLAKKAKMEKKP